MPLQQTRVASIGLRFEFWMLLALASGMLSAILQAALAAQAVSILCR